ncbi:MAG: biotin--[acetyl-CoA-carboxylase] ligase [Flavobacterium sp.]|nr:biotin--[acetyl-CoA-carboxylase] ligase [Flavobacterium sp.]
MRIVKLDATESTNDYLKQWSRREVLPNFTVVTAENQTKGKGQRDAVWESEAGKNLTVSVYVSETSHFQYGIFSMNIAVAVALLDTCRVFDIPEITVKWPNDILSGSKKIAGILIENVLASDGRFTSIIGIGLNVNQSDFGNLSSASSMANTTGRIFDRSAVLEGLLSNLMTRLADDPQKSSWIDYRSNLFRKDLESEFELPDGSKLRGVIRDVDHHGQLCIEIATETRAYGLKQIKLVY